MQERDRIALALENLKAERGDARLRGIFMNVGKNFATFRLAVRSNS